MGGNQIAPDTSLSATEAHVVVRAPDAVEVREASDGHLLESFPAGAGAAWSPEGERIAIADAEGIVHMWDIASRQTFAAAGTCHQTPRKCWGSTSSGVGDGRRLLTRDGDRILRVWDTDSGEPDPDVPQSHC